MNDDIRKKLLSMGDEKLRKFSSSLTPGAENIIGVRLPLLRKFAKELVRNQGQTVLSGEDIYYEEIMLRGMIIGYLKIDDEVRLRLIREFVPKINNWAVCDSFCASLKFVKKKQQMMWNFLQEYIISDMEFYARFGAVMLLDYFCTENYIDKTLCALTKINTGFYYSSMAAAWALAECYIKFPQKTLPYLNENCFDKVTTKRAVQKICDSYRVDDESKKALNATSGT